MRTSRYLMIAVAALCLLQQVATGVPARPGWLEGQSRDRDFRFQLIGDEFANWAVSEDGHTLLSDSRGEWRHAVLQDDGSLAPGGPVYVPGDTPSEGGSRGLRPGPEWLSRQVNSMRERMFSSPAGRTQSRVDGVWNLLLIMIDFPDYDYTYPTGNFDSMMNDEGYGGIGSFRDFYHDMSYDAYDPVSVTTGWYTAQYNHDHYGYNQGWNVSQDLVVEAIEAADPFVDYAEYDNSGDGNVDALLVVHAGPGAEEGDYSNIWSHRWGLWDYGALLRDGVYLFDYTMQPEMQYGGMANIGVYVHEFGHNLGLPDLYDTDYSSSGVGRWCVMSFGAWGAAGDGAWRPVSLSAWCRHDLEWASVTEVETVLTNYPLQAMHQSDEVVRLTSEAGSWQYFMVENRQNAAWDLYLPGSGLLIWHVDESQSGNTEDWHRKVDLEQADGLFELNYSGSSDSGDPYPGSYGNTSITQDTTPDTRPYGGAPTDLAVESISSSGVTMWADYRVTPCGDFTPLAPVVEITAQGSDMLLDWEAVTESVGGCPITVDYYAVYRSGTAYGGFVLLDTTTETQYLDAGVRQLEAAFFYRVTAVVVE